MSCRLKRVASVVMLAGFALAFAGAVDASGVPADVQRQNHLNHDRWARSEPTTPPRKSGDDGDHDDNDNHPATGGHHKGELNGKLHMGDWA